MGLDSQARSVHVFLGPSGLCLPDARGSNMLLGGCWAGIELLGDGGVAKDLIPVFHAGVVSSRKGWCLDRLHISLKHVHRLFRGRGGWICLGRLRECFLKLLSGWKAGVTFWHFGFLDGLLDEVTLLLPKDG